MGIIAILNLFLGLTSIGFLSDIDYAHRYLSGADFSAQTSAIWKLIIYIIVAIALNIGKSPGS